MEGFVVVHLETFPINPTDPMLIFDWRTLYPAPWGHLLPLKTTLILYFVGEGSELHLLEEIISLNTSSNYSL